MITLEQIQELEQKVTNAVELINQLRQENDTLKEELDDLKGIIGSMEKEQASYNTQQEVIEKGISKAIAQLTEVGSGEVPLPSSEPAQKDPVAEEVIVASEEVTMEVSSTEEAINPPEEEPTSGMELTLLSEGEADFGEDSDATLPQEAYLPEGEEKPEDEEGNSGYPQNLEIF